MVENDALPEAIGFVFNEGFPGLGGRRLPRNAQPFPNSAALGRIGSAFPTEKFTAPSQLRTPPGVPESHRSGDTGRHDFWPTKTAYFLEIDFLAVSKASGKRQPVQNVTVTSSTSHGLWRGCM